jgi:LacI family transcriptional regulator
MYTREVHPPAALRVRPVILLNCLAEDFGAPSVVPDECAAGRTAAQTLLEAGHRDRVHVLGGHHVTDRTPAGAHAGHQRMQGIQDAFREAGARLHGVTECGWEPEEGYQHVRALLAHRLTGQLPSAFICCNDRLALGAYQALQEAGLSVPDDVSVVSFDDSVLSSWLRPPLSSVALPHYELGRTAVELLLAGELEPVTHRIPMPLHARSSVKHSAGRA